MSQGIYTIHGINGPVVTVVGGRGLALMDMVNVGEQGLTGEVVRVDGGTTTVTTYSFERKPAGYNEYYYSAADAIYRLPLIIMDDTAAGRASMYGWTTNSEYVKLSTGRYVLNQNQYTYTADQFFAPDNLVIEEDVVN